MEDMKIEKQLQIINERNLLMQFQQPEEPLSGPEIIDEYEHNEMILLTLSTIRQLFEVVGHM